MKTRVGLLALFLLPVLIASCASFSNRYTEANIRIATNPRVVADMQFVDGWSTQAGTAYSAQAVGIMVANDLAKKGWHDVCVLVELTARGDSLAPSWNITAHLNIWQISIYR